MKYFNKFLLLLFSVFVFFDVSINTYNYVYADDEDVIETTEESETEKVSQTIKFLDEEGNPLEIEDTISIQDLSGEGDSFIYDENGNPEYAYQIENGEVTFTNLEKGKIYYLLFDGDVETENHYYIFKATFEDEDEQYYSMVSFKANGENDLVIYQNQLKFLDELILSWNNEGLTQEEIESRLTDIFNTDNVMYINSGSVDVTNNCLTTSITASASSYIDGSSRCTVSNSSSTSISAGSSKSVTFTYTCTSANVDKVKITATGKKSASKNAVIGGSASFSCSDVNPQVCTPNSTQTCNNGTSATQYYDGNGGSCGKSSDTRTRSNGSRKCASDGMSWGSCGYGSWSGSVSAPSCSKGNGTDTRTISFNSNVASDSASQNVTGTDSKQISRTIYYNHNGWSGYSTTFTSNQTATAQWSTSYGSWSTITLPVATRTGYTFKGWEYGGTTYSAGTTVDPQSDRTYNAQWRANNYTYTIKYVSSTGKDLGGTTITKAFDGVNIV